MPKKQLWLVQTRYAFFACHKIVIFVLRNLIKYTAMHYKSIFISDVHLGTRGCSADELCVFLKNNTCENLFLVGDIVDGWRIRKRWYWPQSHTNVIRRILTSSKRGTNVYYLPGNHDEAIRKFLMYDIELGNIKFIDRCDYLSIDGKRFLIIHGDFFDVLMLDKKWLMHVGDTLYDFMIWFNLKLNQIRTVFGMEYWSLSNYLKQNTKQALSYISRFEDHLADYCKENNYDGIICGHIHKAEIRTINGIVYMNDGDWVESRTALVEHTDGTWEIVEYDKTNIDSNRQLTGSD
jgi:UDP-2,3-diacylglucosamine pyrophosphatase LpxH